MQGMASVITQNNTDFMYNNYQPVEYTDGFLNTTNVTDWLYSKTDAAVKVRNKTHCNMVCFQLVHTLS